MSELDFKSVIDNRYSGSKRIIVVKFYTILAGIIFLVILTVFLYLIAYTDTNRLFWIDLDIDFIYNLRYYIYWIIFFNNILIPMSIVYLYFLFIDNINILKFTGERKKLFNDDETSNF